jgi:hypothetical protein
MVTPIQAAAERLTFPTSVRAGDDALARQMQPGHDNHPSHQQGHDQHRAEGPERPPEPACGGAVLGQLATALGRAGGFGLEAAALGFLSATVAQADDLVVTVVHVERSTRARWRAPEVEGQQLLTMFYEVD